MINLLFILFLIIFPFSAVPCHGNNTTQSPDGDELDLMYNDTPLDDATSRYVSLIMDDEFDNKIPTIIPRNSVLSKIISLNITTKTSGLPLCPQRDRTPLSTCFTCTRESHRVRFSTGNKVCAEKNTCDLHYMDPSCTSCGETDMTCDFKRTFFIDDYTCQDVEPKGEDYAVSDVMPYCRIGGDVISECTEDYLADRATIYWYSFGSRVYYLTSPSWVHRQDPMNMDSYTCKGDSCTNLKLCKRGKCKGDVPFCKFMGCSGVIKCSCEMKEHSGYLSISTDQGAEIIPECLGISVLTVLVRSRFRRQAPLSCRGCTADCRKHRIHLITNRPNNYLYKFCQSSSCVSGNGTGSPSEISIPPYMSLMAADGHIDIWFPPHQGSVRIPVRCEGMDYCEILDCMMCYEMLMNPSCWTVYHQILIAICILVVIIMCLLLLLIIFYLLKIVLHCCLGVKAFFYVLSRCLSGMWGCCKKGKDKGKGKDSISRFDNVDSDEEYGKPLLPIRQYSKFGKFLARSSNPHLHIIAITLIMLATVVEPCAVSTTFQSQSHDCVYTRGGVQSCDMSNDIRLALAPVGQDSCYTVKDPEGKPMGSIIIRTESIKLVCDAELLYFVPEARSECMSIRHCRAASNCKGSNCEQWKHTDPIEGQSDEASGTGWSGCKRSCGCSGCGCFICSSACVFFRKYLYNPTKTAYTVHTCPQWTYSVALTVIKTTASGADTKRILLKPGMRKTLFKSTFSLISISIPPQPVLSKCFLSDGVMTSLIPCNARDEISMGKIGEVQCNSIYAAKTMHECIADHKLISVTLNRDSVSCYSNLMSPLALLKKNPLPMHLDGMLLTTNGTEIVAEMHHIALLEMQISSSTLSFEEKTEKNMCFVEFVSLRGCYSCLPGASLSLIVNTDFGTAMGLVHCEGTNINIPLTVLDVKKTVNITIHLDNPEIEKNCQIQCPAGTSSFKMKGTLVYVPITDSRKVSEGSGIVIEAPDGGVDWSGLTISAMFGRWWKIMLWTVLIAIALSMCIWCVVSRKSSKTVRFKE